MKISKKTVCSYLMYILSIELEGDDINVSDHLDEFDSGISTLARKMSEDGQADDMELVFDFLISFPEKVKEIGWQGVGYPFSNEELSLVLTYAARRIWPGFYVCEPKDVLPIEFF